MRAALKAGPGFIPFPIVFRVRVFTRLIQGPQVRVREVSIVPLATKVASGQSVSVRESQPLGTQVLRLSPPYRRQP